MRNKGQDIPKRRSQDPPKSELSTFFFWRNNIPLRGGRGGVFQAKGRRGRRSTLVGPGRGEGVSGKSQMPVEGSRPSWRFEGDGRTMI